MTEASRLERPMLRLRFLDTDGDTYQTTISTTRRPSTGLTDTMKGETNEGTVRFRNDALRLGKLLEEVTDSILVSIELIGSSTTELQSDYAI